MPDRGRRNSGHVLPSLAVAEALRERGVHVTFAGSPDRVEARLVPEAGYELDTFGSPASRAAFARAAALAAHGGPRAARLRARSCAPRGRTSSSAAGLRRRADGLRRVARKIPAALTEADAHLGLANRLAAPFAKRVFLAYAIAGRDGKYRVTGRPVPRAHAASRRRRAARASACRPTSRCSPFFGALAGRAA